MGHDSFYVYVLFRETGIPFYVGKGCRDRMDAHLTPNWEGRIRNNYKLAIIKAMQRSGLDVPRVRVATNLSEADAFSIETLFIRAIGRMPNGPLVNLSDGGEGPSGRTLSEAHKRSIRQASLGKKHSEASKKKMAESAKARVHQSRTGMKHSAETKQKMADAAKRRFARDGHPCLGQKRSEAARQRMSVWQKGRKPSPECIEAAKKANSGGTFTGP